MKKTILCVEDEVVILYNNRDMLIADGYNVLTAENLSQARGILAEAQPQPDLIVLDIMLPDGNGLNYLRELRDAGNNIPVVMLTAWNRSDNIAHGLNLGADDYIGKPFEYEVLLARIKKVLEQSERIPERISRGGLMLIIRTMEVVFGERKIKLPPVEFFLLQLLIENEGKDIDSETIYDRIWGADMNEDPSAVRSAVKRLRKKIEGSGYVIKTVYNKGYRFEKEP